MSALRSARRFKIRHEKAGIQYLTKPARDAAMQPLQCGRVMTEIVDRILLVSGRGDLDAQSRAKVMRYLETLRSAGNRDEQQLTTFGLAYLDQLFNPDPRYSGC